MLIQLCNNFLKLIMSHQQRNKELLYNHKPYHKMCEEEIEMEIIQRSPRSKQVQHHQQSAPQYFILEDKNPQHQRQAQRSKRDQIPLQQPFNDKIITMNGQTFKLVEDKPKEPKPSKSKLPSMLTSCHNCKTVQSVPGTSEMFDCGVCRMRNQCVPAYAILRCYSCNIKVLYKVGKSQFIKCTKCQTVNKIPSNARNVRGSSYLDPNYKVYFDKNSMQSEHTVNPYLRECDESQLQELPFEDWQLEKYPDL